MDGISGDRGLTVVTNRQPLTIHLTGEFGVRNLTRLQGLVDGLGDVGDVVIDAGEVTLASIALIDCLLELSWKLAASPHDLVLRSPSQTMQLVLDMTQTADMFTVIRPPAP